MTNEIRSLLTQLRAEITRFPDNEYSTGSLGQCVKLLNAIAKASLGKPPVELVRKRSSRFALLSINPTEWQSSDDSFEVRIVDDGELHLVRSEISQASRSAIVAGIDCWLATPSDQKAKRGTGAPAIDSIDKQVSRIRTQVLKYCNADVSGLRSTAKTNLQDQKAKWPEAFQKVIDTSQSVEQKKFLRAIKPKPRNKSTKKRMR